MNQYELNQLLDLHELWVKDETQGKRLELVDQNLSGLDFSGRNLFSAVFDNCTFINSNLQNVILEETECDLCNFMRASFVGATIERSYFWSCYFSNVNMQQATVVNPKWYTSVMVNIDTTGARFFRADLSDIRAFEDSVSIDHLMDKRSRHLEAIKGLNQFKGDR